MTVAQYEDPTYLEAVYEALLAQLKTATFSGGISLKTIERVTIAPDEVAAVNQPALFLIEGPLHAEQKEIFGPTKWTFSAFAVIYVRADGSFPSQAQVLAQTTANYLIWGIKNSFATKPPYGKQTLGGLVYHCWIEGDVFPEVMDNQMILAVPIMILPGPV